MEKETGGSKPTACKTCIRRRIKCDLQRPACRKCLSRGLECPGYGPRLRWVGGVASRGYLKGRSLPTRDHDEAAHTNQVIRNDQGRGNHSSMSLGDSHLYMTQLSTLLLDYYDKKIAGTMVWLDSEENQYRQRAIPLARCRPGLLWAIMALSAHHGSSTLENGEGVSESAHNESLSAIRRVTEELSNRLSSSRELNDDGDVENAEWLLASSMVMSNYHNVRSSTEASDCHRKGARVFFNIFKSTRARNSGFFQFLQSQLAICDVLAAVTVFNDADNSETILPSLGTEREPFAEYLRLLHQVTLESRRPVPGAGEWTPASLRTSFEQAKTSTIQAAADRIRLTPGPISRDFFRMVDVYHDVALLYAYRVLGLRDRDEFCIGEHEQLASTLFQHLEEFEDQSRWAHNMPWPAFIAGVESHGNQARQTAVENLFTVIYACTGFNHYLEVVEFLRAFWGEQESDWRRLAQQWTSKGRRIIIY